MSLLAEIAERSVWRPGPTCTVSRIMRALNDEDRADLATALGSDSFTIPAIRATLIARGHLIGVETLKRHRRGECRCRS